MGTFVFGGNLTCVVVLNRGGDGGALLAGATCLGGSGGGRFTVRETSGGGGFGDGFEGEATRGSAWVFTGGGFATDESMTTIFPAPPFLMGNWVV